VTRRKIIRAVLLVAILAGIGWGAYRLFWYEPVPPTVAPPDFNPTGDELPTNEQFAELCRTDVLAALEVGLTRYAREVKGYRAVLHKRERIGGVLHEPEVVRVAIAHDPLRVRMMWDKGARKTLGFLTVAALYSEGQNGNQTKVWRPDAILDKTPSVDPMGKDFRQSARHAARYTMTESAFDKSMLRTLMAWREARNRGDAPPVYVGFEKVEELGGRMAHIIRRTCPVPEVDSFAMTEAPSKDPAKIKNDGHSEVTIMLDAETWLQTGTFLKRIDGETTASYYFRDVELNPTFPPETFTVEALKKK
jgi:hypothetical protein